jgi:electron transport complex protein RnfB
MVPETARPHTAVVAEALCIGCNACFQVCPTGALVGAPKQIHAVMADLCTGCGACLPVCPVPCLTLQPWPLPQHPLQGANAPAAAALVAQHQQRMAQRTIRHQAPVAVAMTAQIPQLPPEIAALATQARHQSQQKYQKMGPLRRPRALKQAR